MALWAHDYSPRCCFFGCGRFDLRNLRWYGYGVDVCAWRDDRGAWVYIRPGSAISSPSSVTKAPAASRESLSLKMNFKKLVALISIPFLLTAGGTVPEGMGGWDNGARDPIPSSPRRMSYKFIGLYSGVEFDYVSLAVASLDYELPNTRIWYGQAIGNVGQIWFSKVDQPATVGCSDSDPATFCKLAETICEQWGANAGSKYRLCDGYRIRLYALDIYVYAARTDRDPATVWHNIVRHETGHVLGFPHNGGMMGNDFDQVLPLTECQHQLLDQYTVNPESLEWVYLSAPMACE